jgi:erythronate-4-phosphate dehydrogenase
MGADVISLHVPLTHSGQDATYHAFDEERLCRMKPGSVLINTARGAVVDTGALKRALRTGQISAAILDVWENEPAIDLELLGLALIATPHIAGYSLDGKLNAARMIFEALRTYTGAAAGWEAPPEMPQPGSPSIDSRGIAADGHVWLDEIVNRCYDIRRDCESLQRLLLLPDTERAHRFRELRATYPIRREFASTTVLVSAERSEEGAALRALGFVVREA